MYRGVVESGPTFRLDSRDVGLETNPRHQRWRPQAESGKKVNVGTVPKTPRVLWGAQNAPAQDTKAVHSPAPHPHSRRAPHPLCLPQSLRELAVPVPLRDLHRGAAGLFYGGGAGLLFEPSSVGFVGQIGMDYMLGKNWGLNVDVKYATMATNVQAVNGGANLGKLTLNPWMPAVGVTYKF